MFCLLYSSVPEVTEDQDELDTLVAVSRRNNERDGVAGCLLHVYEDGGASAFFVQVLEGEKEPVERVFARIAVDPRHREVEVLSSGPASGPRFAGTPMRLAELSVAGFRAAARWGGPGGPSPASATTIVRDPRSMSVLLASYGDAPASPSP